MGNFRGGCGLCGMGEIIMSKCNSQADLYREMARVYEMCKGTIFEGKEYQGVKIDGVICIWFPSLLDNKLSHEFALGIVEDKLVWEGDKLYWYADTKANSIEIKTPLVEQQKWSWNPPAPPKTLTLLGENQLDTALVIAELQKELLEILDKKPMVEELQAAARFWQDKAGLISEELVAANAVIEQMREALIDLTGICITQVGADYNDAIHAAFLKGKEALTLGLQRKANE